MLLEQLLEQPFGTHIRNLSILPGPFWHIPILKTSRLGKFLSGRRIWRIGSAVNKFLSGTGETG